MKNTTADDVIFEGDSFIVEKEEFNKVNRSNLWKR